MSEFLRGRMRYLTMLHYLVDEKALKSFLPMGLELDAYNKKHFIGIYGFYFDRGRVRGLPVPFLRDAFHLQVRVYVKRKVGRTVRRGYLVIDHQVSSRAMGVFLQKFSPLKLKVLAIAHRINPFGEDWTPGGRVEYFWFVKSRREHLAFLTTGRPKPMKKNAPDWFFTQRDFAYYLLPDGRGFEMPVEWSLLETIEVAESSFHAVKKGLFGKKIADLLRSEPAFQSVALEAQLSFKDGETLALQKKTTKKTSKKAAKKVVKKTKPRKATTKAKRTPKKTKPNG